VTKGKRIIHGMGRVGKTRAAIECAWKHADDHRAHLFTFDRLDAAQLDQIVKIQFQRVIDRLAKQNIHLTVTDDTTRYLADAGFDPVFGARPLRRAIQKHLLDPLSLAVPKGGFKDGDQITAVMKGGKPVFEKK